MNFFKLFPTVDYDINRTGTVQRMVDIFRSVRPLQSYVDNPSLYTFYEIKNGERPDVVSQRLYGTSQFYWTFFIINDFLHDGMRAWPMSQETLFDYLKQEYNGFAITTQPEIVTNTDGQIIEFKNSIVGKFTLDEKIRGGTSNALGTFVKRDLDLNQIVIQDVTGTFQGDGAENNNNYEFLVGQTSGDSVQTYKVYPYAEAPHHYYKLNDKEERPVSNLTFIETADVGTIITNTNESGQSFTEELFAESIPTPAGSLGYKSNRQYINELNESRSKIRVINSKYISKFVDEFERLINV